MLSKRPDLPFWLNIAATALLMFVAPPRNVRERRWGSKGSVGKEERPFGEPQSSEEPRPRAPPGA